MLEILITVLISFLTVVMFMPKAIRALKEKGITGIDVHKPDRPEIPKGGGFVLLFGIVFALLAVVGLTTFQTFTVEMVGIFAALVSILLASMIGLLDDQLDFSNRTKIILQRIKLLPNFR